MISDTILERESARVSVASASSPTSSRCLSPIRRDRSPSAMALVRSRICVTGRVTDRVISTEARMLNATPASAETMIHHQPELYAARLLDRARSA